ncbi:hypothetical protein F5887DRAFT_930675 [Amanita rubescens]|nr:hypothetical protein F5887DRAFT_930675 [Amanita rubescens]
MRLFSSYELPPRPPLRCLCKELLQLSRSDLPSNQTQPFPSLKHDNTIKSGSRPPSPSPETFWPPLGHVGLNSDDDSMAPSVASSHQVFKFMPSRVIIRVISSESSLSGHEDEPHIKPKRMWCWAGSARARLLPTYQEGKLLPNYLRKKSEQALKEQAMAQTQGQPEASSSRHPPNSGHEGHSEASSSRHPPNSHHDGQSEASSSKSPPSPQDNHALKRGISLMPPPSRRPRKVTENV